MSQFALTNTDQQTLTQLVEDGQGLMLRKAEAMKLLIHRGYKMTMETLKPEFV